MAIIFVDKPHGSLITRTFSVAITARPTGYHRGELQHERRIELGPAAMAIKAALARALETKPLEVIGHLNVITVTLPGNDMWTEKLEATIIQIITEHLNTTEKVDTHRKY